MVRLSNAREWLTRSGPVGGWHSDAVRDRNMTYTASTAAASANRKKRGERDPAKELEVKRTKFLQDTDRLYEDFSDSVKLQIGSAECFQYLLLAGSKEVWTMWREMSLQVRRLAPNERAARGGASSPLVGVGSVEEFAASCAVDTEVTCFDNLRSAAGPPHAFVARALP